MDLFLVGKGIAGLITSCKVLKDTAVPTHRPVMLTLSLRGSPEAVRNIRLPKDIECPQTSEPQP